MIYNIHTMLFEYYTIAIIGILAAISPGPDFVVVAKYALAQNRKNAIMSSLGIGTGILVHTSYCVLGLALVISKSLLLFSLIKYLGAAYLIYLGIKSLLSKSVKASETAALKLPAVSAFSAFRDGLLTNVLNPKCTLFMLSIFTLVVKPNVSEWIQASYGIELSLIAAVWFVFLSYGFTHEVVKKRINKAQRYVSKIIGTALIGLGLLIAFESHK